MSCYFKDRMTKLIFIILLVLCSSCAQLPVEVPLAPQKNAYAVVFDIDGTLTPTVMKYRDVRSKAAKAAHIYADMGHKIFYVSARVPFLQGGIPDWLAENGFPKGYVYVIETKEYLTSHAKFKKRILEKIKARGWKVEFAYGDSTTDFEAYADVGIPKQRVYALRREGDKKCQPGIWKACLKGWTEHIDSIAKTIVACQGAESVNSDSC